MLRASQLDLFRGLSFCTISSTGPNAGTFIFLICIHHVYDSPIPQAIVHYSPDPVNSAVIKKDQVLAPATHSLCTSLTTHRYTFAIPGVGPTNHSITMTLKDPPGQYWDGTTDVTRTWVRIRRFLSVRNTVIDSEVL